MNQQIDECIAGAANELSALRDQYEILLCEYFKLLYKEERSEEEENRLTELEEERTKIEKYIDSIKKEFWHMFDRLSKQ